MIKIQALILGWINDERLPKAYLGESRGEQSREVWVEVCHRESFSLLFKTPNNEIMYPVKDAKPSILKMTSKTTGQTLAPHMQLVSDQPSK